MVFTLQEQRIFFAFYCPLQPTSLRSPEDVVQVIPRPGGGTYYSSRTGSKVMKAWSYISRPQTFS
jgi:hypothetical protein